MIAFTIIRSIPNAPELSPKLQRRGLATVSILYAGQWGIFLVSGLAGDMIDLDAEPTAIVLGVINSKVGYAVNPDLDKVITEPIRVKINTWLTARGYPNIPIGWTYKQVILAILRRFWVKADLDKFYLQDET